jgi:hypothetical protein
MVSLQLGVKTPLQSFSDTAIGVLGFALGVLCDADMSLVPVLCVPC